MQAEPKRGEPKRVGSLERQSDAAKMSHERGHSRWQQHRIEHAIALEAPVEPSEDGMGRGQQSLEPMPARRRFASSSFFHAAR
jgi:hypothetical protein